MCLLKEVRLRVSVTYSLCQGYIWGLLYPSFTLYVKHFTLSIPRKHNIKSYFCCLP